MTIRLSHTTTAPGGELPVELNDAGTPFATIDLDTAGRTYLTLHTPADCDRLIRAAVEAKRLLSPTPPEPPDFSDAAAALIAEDAVALIGESIRTGVPLVVLDDDPEPMMMLVLGDPETDPVTRLITAGHTLTFDLEAVAGRCFARLTAPDGTLAQGGYGGTREEALTTLRERLARQQATA